MRRLLRHAAIAAVFWGGCAHAPKSPQTGTLTGKVVDERGSAVAGVIWGRVVDDEDHGIPSASVIVMNALTGAVADGAGRFLIRIRAGTYTLRARCAGFAPADRERVRVSEGDTTLVDFKLRPRKIKIMY